VHLAADGAEDARRPDVVEILKQNGIGANIAKLSRLPRKKVD